MFECVIVWIKKEGQVAATCWPYTPRLRWGTCPVILADGCKAGLVWLTHGFWQHLRPSLSLICN